MTERTGVRQTGGHDMQKRKRRSCLRALATLNEIAVQSV